MADADGPHLAPNRLPPDQRAAIEQPYLEQLADLGDALDPELANRIYTLGFAAGAAVTNAQIAYEDGTAQETAGLKFIGDVPVVSEDDMRRFAVDMLGYSPAQAGVARRIFNVLRRHKQHWTETDEQHGGISKLVYDSTRLFDWKEQPIEEGFASGVYIDLRGMLDMTKVLLDLPVRNNKIETDVYQLNIGAVRFMARLLNHKLQLDPPLEAGDQGP